MSSTPDEVEDLMAKDTVTDTLEQQLAELVGQKGEESRPSASETEQPYRSRHEDAEQFADRSKTHEGTGASSQESRNPTSDATPTSELRADDRDRVKESTKNQDPVHTSRVTEGSLATTIGGLVVHAITMG